MLAPNRTFRPTRPRPTARTLQGLFAEPLQSSLPGKASPVCPRLRIIRDPIARLNPDLPACASHADRPAAQVHAAQAGKRLIFTEHRDTLKSLAKRLEDKGYTVATIHGGMDVDARKQAQREFRTRAKIMVATDAAGEGKTRADISIYSQESNDTTSRLAKMNRAIRGIDEEFEEVTEGEDEVGEIHVEELEGVADA